MKPNPVEFLSAAIVIIAVLYLGLVAIYLINVGHMRRLKRKKPDQYPTAARPDKKFLYKD